MIESIRMKYSLSVGSSVEGLKYARAMQQNLQYEAVVTVWPQGIFRPSNFPLEDLLSTVANHDFGAFIFLPEDVLILRGQREAVVRDNVLFELGLFFGRLGRQRAFLLKPRGEEMHLPGEPAVLAPAEFDLNESNPQAGIGAASTAILTQMEKIGCRSATGTAPVFEPAQRYDREAAILHSVATAERKPLLRGRQYMRIDATPDQGRHAPRTGPHRLRGDLHLLHPSLGEKEGGIPDGSKAEAEDRHDNDGDRTQVGEGMDHGLGGFGLDVRLGGGRRRRTG